jgi:hypothetical protein
MQYVNAVLYVVVYIQDFYNLINVYLDAVLFPRAVKDPLVMQQEVSAQHAIPHTTLISCAHYV